MFYPSGPGINLADFAVGIAFDFSLAVDEQNPASGGSLVKSHDIPFFHDLPSLFGDDRA
jgi:hypothetical protein